MLEAFSRLCQQPEGEGRVEILRRYAPSWLAQLSALLSEAEYAALQQKVAGSTRERMVREVAEALEVLSAERPLVLVLEDLHWSDVSTLALLSLVARRREAARVLVVATSRPAELVVTNHPLKPLKQELIARGQATEVLLGGLAATAVQQYVHQRGAERAEDTELGAFVYRRTEGHPLFMVQMTDYLVQQRAEAATRPSLLGAVAQAVPHGVRELIDAQVGRLTLEEQLVLEGGSVAGAEFATASVAAGAGLGGNAVEEVCERLARRGHVLEERGVMTWADGTLSGRYGFRHALYQDVLYQRIAEARRIRLHRQIGEQMEGGYGERAQEIAAELAVHFERGQDFPRAVRHLYTAAETALRRNAYAEAIMLLTHALELVKTWPDTPERTQRELALQMALGSAFMATKGYAAPEVERVYSQAQELCRKVGETPHLFSVLMGLFAFRFVRAEMHAARDLGEQCLSLAQSARSRTSLMWAHSALGQALFGLGELSLAQEHLEQSIALYDPQRHNPFVSRTVQDAKVLSLCYTAPTFWLLGYPDQALEKVQGALTLAQDLSHPFSLGWAFNYAARLHQLRRERQAAGGQAEALIALAGEQGFALLAALGTIFRGWALTGQGQAKEGIAQIRQGLDAHLASGAGMGRSYYLALLAEAYRDTGQAKEGLAVLAEALAVVEKAGERWYKAELYRLKGELTLQQWKVTSDKSKVKSDKGKEERQKAKGKRQHQLSVVSSQLLVPSPQPLTPSTPGGVQEAEESFLKALDIAQQQQAKSLELRAVMSLSRLWQSQGKKEAAQQRLVEIYGWFTEGFDTKDLQEAQALLDELQH